LKKYFVDGSVKRKGKFIIGTVEGDLHDIGKNLVCMIAEGNGYEVIDLGVDVPAEKFIEAIKLHPGAYVGMSALLTTTMANMEKINRQIKAEFPDTIACVGGAPLNSEFAQQIGADYYTDEPQALVDVFDKLVG
jgi:5-methyltetrahydrofolate--homocysteine methyltransferase